MFFSEIELKEPIFFEKKSFKFLYFYKNLEML